MIRKIIILFLLSFSISTASERDFILFPDTVSKWDLKFALGVSVSHLPVDVVEEEISVVPLLRFDARVGIPWDISIYTGFSSNYLVNIGKVGLEKNLLNQKFKAGLGFDFSGWFGHVDMDAIKLKARGMILAPYFTIAYDYDDLLVSFRSEYHFITYWTDDNEGSMLGKIKVPEGGTCAQITLEQPLWKDNWVYLSLRLYYGGFFYQAWISYNTIDDNILYPEILFGFIL